MSVRSALCALLVFVFAAPAQAQSPLPPDSTAPGSIQAGPVALTPAFEITNAGVDSNVFNDADGPQEDFTATLRPRLDARLRFGPGRVSYRSWMEAVYFHEFENERAVNRFGEVRGELRFSRFVPYVFASGLRTSDRPNNEIDLRAARGTQIAGGGLALAVLSRTAIVTSVRRETTTYDEGQIFGGEDLAEQFNHTKDIVDGGIRVALTPLTTITLLGSREVAEFERSPGRNATSYRIGPQLDFDPTALISGTVAVGYRRFTPVSAAMREYSGVAALVTARYTLPSTSFVVRFRRDLEYSFEELQPYYVTTGGGLTVTQRIAGAFDVQGTASRERLSYQARTDVDADLLANSVDTTDLYGGGIGYRLRETARLGINIEFATREAHREGRSYDRRRIFASLTYGF